MSVQEFLFILHSVDSLNDLISIRLGQTLFLMYLKLLVDCNFGIYNEKLYVVVMYVLDCVK